MISVETDIVVDHFKEEKFEESKPGLLPSLIPCLKSLSSQGTCLCLWLSWFVSCSAASERLTQEQADDLLSWMKNVLGSRVANVKVRVWDFKFRGMNSSSAGGSNFYFPPWCGPQLTPRLDTHPAMITVLEMGAARHFLRTQQLARTPEERAQLLQPTLELNAGWERGVYVAGGCYEMQVFFLFTCICAPFFYLTDMIWSRSCTNWKTPTLTWPACFWNRYCQTETLFFFFY